VPTTSTKMTANITAYSAMSCPASSPQNLSTVTNHYVEKKTLGWTVPVAECPKAIGAGFAETGCFFAKAMSSRSILRCSCGMRTPGWVMQRFFHSPQEPAQWRISND